MTDGGAKPRAADDFEAIRERMKELERSRPKEEPAKPLCSLCGTDGSGCNGACCD